LEGEYPIVRRRGSAGFQPARCRPDVGAPFQRSDARVQKRNRCDRRMKQATTPKGWYSRGYLPHLDTPGLVQSITFRLVDSLPNHVIKRILATTMNDDLQRRRRIEEYLDSGRGECWLRRPDIAHIVERALLHFDGTRYRLLAWVIMPNHVHVLIETKTDHPLAKTVQSWKTFTARESNLLLQRSGRFWERDYFDRYMRDEAHLQAVIAYIENNPVRAGLVAKPGEWPFGSARRRLRGR
jgi:REP element-mobilizing transposase RayT